MPFFFGSDYDTLIEVRPIVSLHLSLDADETMQALPTCVSIDRPAKYVHSLRLSRSPY